MSSFSKLVSSMNPPLSADEQTRFNNLIALQMEAVGTTCKYQMGPFTIHKAKGLICVTKEGPLTSSQLGKVKAAAENGTVLCCKDAHSTVTTQQDIDAAYPAGAVLREHISTEELLAGAAAALSKLHQVKDESEGEDTLEQEHEFEVVEKEEAIEEDDTVIVDKIEAIEDDYVEV